MNRVAVLAMTFALAVPLSAQTAKVHQAKKEQVVPRRKPVSSYMQEVGKLYMEQVDSAIRSMEDATAEIKMLENMIYGPHSPSTDMDMLDRQRDAARRKKERAHDQLKSATSLLDNRMS